MRVISIIVHLIAFCDPDLHKTIEVAHPSVLNTHSVNFTLLLSFFFQKNFFSLEASGNLLSEK